MARFLIGVLFGVVLSVGYVRYELELPAWLQLADRLRGNLVSTAIEAELYDLDRDAASRRRALEVYFDHRAADAAKLDAEAGHPFLTALHRQRAAREARALTAEWSAFGAVLAKPELRSALEKRHATADDDTLKRRMLAASLKGKPFLERWLAANGGDGADLLATLRKIGDTRPAAVR